MLTLQGRDLTSGAGLVLEISDGLITAMRTGDEVAPDAPWIAPGLVDLQVNGFGDGDANATRPSAEEITRMARALAARGVTRFLPTVITASREQMRARIGAIADACRDPLTAAMVAGIHVEGPSLSEQDGPRGVHPLEHIRPPDVRELDSWLEAADGLLRIVTLSPHHPGTVDAVTHLVQHGVRVSVGHTHADEEQITAAVDAGASLCTHLGNGAHAVLPRHPNYIWTQLAEGRLAAGVIADGHHLPASTLKAMIAAKRDHGVFLVSDAVATPRTLVEDGVSTVGGGVALAADGALRHVASGFLAGSVQALDIGVANAAGILGSLADAVRLASIVPSLLLDGRDPWRVGARADVLRFSWQPGDMAITPVSVHVAGERVR